MIEITNLKVSYGVIQALKGIDLKVEKGEIVSLIGANGAGKTTLLKTISGLLRPYEGTITLNGKSLVGMQGNKILQLGLAQVPEGRQVFASLSVEENLELGGYLLKNKEVLKQNIKSMYKMFPRLLERKRQLAGTLSGGEQQMLAIGRALMSNPSIVLFDEPSMGLSPLLVKEVFSVIKKINEAGTTVLLVEQNAKMALSIADRAYVLETGKVVLSGSGRELLNDNSVKKAYLGK